jgi:hypothetical protein
MKTVNELFRDVIALNEGGDVFALTFSDPDGVRSGKSGWSFGLCQFDTQNNDAALECLAECGFTEEEIAGICHQTINVKPLERKLREHADVIARYDMAQLQHCLDAAGQFLEGYKLAVQDAAALLAIADTINQYGSLGNGAAGYLRRLNHPATAGDILNMKLTWKYAQSQRGYHDTVRRYQNIMQVMEAFSG